MRNKGGQNEFLENRKKINIFCNYLSIYIGSEALVGRISKKLLGEVSFSKVMRHLHLSPEEKIGLVKDTKHSSPVAPMSRR